MIAPDVPLKNLRKLSERARPPLIAAPRAIDKEERSALVPGDDADLHRVFSLRAHLFLDYRSTPHNESRSLCRTCEGILMTTRGAAKL